MKQFKFGILAKMSFALATVAIAYLIAGTLVGREIEALRLAFVQLAEVEHPMTAAVYEMEINVIGSGLGVAKYLHRPDREHLERVAKDQADFVHFLSRYKALADDDHERTLISSIEGRFDAYYGSGQRLIALRNDEGEQGKLFGGALAAMEHSIDSDILPTIENATLEGRKKLELAALIRSDLEEALLLAARGVFQPDSIEMTTIKNDVADLRSKVAAFSALPLTPPEQDWIAVLSRDFDQAQRSLGEIVALESAIKREFEIFNDLRGQLDGLLDEQIQMLASHSLASASTEVTDRVQDTLFSLAGASFLILATVLLGLLFLSRTIVLPVRSLATAAKSIAKGDLTYRVALTARDELGDLAAAFNGMADRLQDARRHLTGANVLLEATVAMRTMQLQDELTVRRETERELIDANRRAESANQAKSAFLANVSHELRTPLNAIMGFADAIRNEALGPVGTARYRDYAAAIVGSGEDLLALIGKVLDLSSAELGRLSLDRVQVEIAPLLEACRDAVSAAAEEKSITIDLDVAAELSPVFVDAERIKQVLCNLLDNAVKFSPEGGRVLLRAWPNSDGALKVAVVDQGPGMSAEQRSAALEPFSRADPTLAKEQSGSGLGLALGHRLAELHGGSLSIDSAPDRGTTVTLSLPAQ